MEGKLLKTGYPTIILFDCSNRESTKNRNGEGIPQAVRARNISFSNSDSSLKPGKFSNFQ